MGPFWFLKGKMEKAAKQIIARKMAERANKEVNTEKLSAADKELKNRATMKEIVSDIGAPNDQLKAKADKMQNPNSLEANMLRAQGALNEAQPAVAGITQQPILSGAQYVQKLAKIREQSKPVIDELKKSRSLMRPEFFDDAVNIAKRAVTENKKPMDETSIRRILQSYEKLKK